jgi:hypothetical protein
MEEEIWKPIEGYEGRYQVSSLGRVRSYRKIKKDYVILKNVERKGYYRNYVGGKMISTHILVAQAFIENKDNKPYINHKNGDKMDNRMENLEWCTRSENAHHAYSMGLMKQGQEHCQAKPLMVIDLKGNHIITLYGQKQWKEFGLDCATVQKCIAGKRKSHKGYTFRYEQ